MSDSDGQAWLLLPDLDDAIYVYPHQNQHWLSSRYNYQPLLR